ncbi:MAG: cyclic nucleotide-binding domain-containing protein [Polyangiales bacterium]
MSGEAEQAAEAAEEAAWELETAETLRARGDLEGARSWFLRAADHLMDAGEDDRALEVAKLAASLAEASSVTPPPSSEAPAPQGVTPVVIPAPGVTPPPAVAAAEPSIPAPFPPSASINAPPVEPAPAPFPPARSIPAPARSIPAPSRVAPASPPVPSAPPRPGGARSSSPPRDSLVWRADRTQDLETLWARLLALPLFQDFTPNRLRALARQVSLLRLDVGDALLRALPFGEEPVDTPMLLITDGAASLWSHGARAPQRLGAGDTAGEAGALYGGPSAVDAVVEEPLTAVSFAPALVRSLLRESESFREVLEELAWERAFAALGHAAPVLQHVPEAARAQVYARFEPFAIKEGDVLLREGESPAWVWIVAAGLVEVYGGALDPRSVWRGRAGDALGIEASVGDGPSGVTVRALRDGLAARVSSDGFRELLLAHPTLRAAVDDIGVTGRAVIC